MKTPTQKGFQKKEKSVVCQWGNPTRRGTQLAPPVFIRATSPGRKYPGIDYALLPTTAYHPRWLMHYAHLNAEETLDAFLDLGARRLIPTQWGTFRLGNEPSGYPVIDLRRAMKSRGFDASKVVILDLGGIQPISPKSNISE